MSFKIFLPNVQIHFISSSFQILNLESIFNFENTFNNNNYFCFICYFINTINNFSKIEGKDFSTLIFCKIFFFLVLNFYYIYQQVIIFINFILGIYYTLQQPTGNVIFGNNKNNIIFKISSKSVFSYNKMFIYISTQSSFRE